MRFALRHLYRFAAIAGAISVASWFACTDRGALRALQRSGGGGQAAAELVQGVRGAVVPSPAFAQIGGASIADIAEKSVASVVNIASTQVVKGQQEPASPFFSDPFFRYFFGDRMPAPGEPAQRKQQSLGSGVIISKDGTILTNNHVVKDADEIKVSMSDGREFDAKIIGTDPKSDVAVIRLKNKVDGLQPLPIGDSSAMRLGDVVLAIGNPFGVGQTVTMGIISAKGRANMGIVDYEDFIQTDAAINPGNSGGALINMKGELIGVNTAIVTRTGGYQGIGFAIPINMAQQIMNSLIKYGKVVRGWLGVAIQDVDQKLADALKLKVKEGVLVSDVQDGSPAQKAGIKRGDVIIKMDGRKVNTTGELRNYIASNGSNKDVTLELVRDGKSTTVKVKTGELPDHEQTKGPGDKGGDAGLLSGLELSTISPSLREQLHIDSRIKSGAVVTGIRPGSKAAESGLRPGDVVLEINRKAIKGPGDVAEALKGSGDRALVLLYRAGSTIYLVISK